MVLRMQVSDIEVLTRHDGPESCGGAREGAVEALTGERVGWVLSREKKRNPSADLVKEWGRQQFCWRFGESVAYSARSEAPCMHVSSLRENREILRSSGYARPERVVKPKGIRR